MIRKDREVRKAEREGGRCKSWGEQEGEAMLKEKGRKDSEGCGKRVRESK